MQGQLDNGKICQGVIEGPPLGILKSRVDKTCTGLTLRANPTLAQKDKLGNSW